MNIRLLIMLIIYILMTLLALGILAGPLRCALDPKGERRWLRIAVLTVLTVLFACPAVGAVLPDGKACYFFQRCGNVFLGFVLYFFGPLLLIRIIMLPKQILYRRRHKTGWKPARRTCVILMTALLALSLVLNIGGAYKAHDVRVTRYEIDKEQLGQKDPLRIVLIGDLHIGVNSHAGLYEDMVERINEQKADLVLVAGDIVTSAFGAMKDPDRYASLFRQIRSTYGTYVVYGNHDVDEPLLGGFTYGGAENAERNPGMPEFLNDCGWKLLADESVRIPEANGLVLAGRRDEKRPGEGIRKRAALKDLLSETKPDDPILLLEHEPAELEELEHYGVDLVVSGHTHDGQVFPGNVYGRIASPQSYGIKDWRSCTAVVTSGVGFYGPPIRVGTISEIAVIDAR